MSTFNLPDLGEGLQEAEVVAWHVAEGDHVVLDQPLVSVETEKAVVEIPSPKAGHVARLLARPGERVKVGAPLLTFEEGAHLESGTVVGELAKPAPSPPTVVAPPRAGSEVVRATPSVRARAKELGVDLFRVTGSGPQGAITRPDVEAVAKTSTNPNETLRGARKTMAMNMARAWREVVHATLHDQADIDSWTPQEDVTVRLIRAIVAGCAAEPSLNAGFDGVSLSLHPNAKIDLGLAIDSPDGLFVPVLRDVGRTTAQEWRRQIDAAKKGVSERSLDPGELRGATITLSNFGTIAGQHAALIVMPPQVAILGAGRITGQPVRSGDSFSLHRTLPLSLSFDHRAITGGEAARFLRAVMSDLEKSA
jgi:pyruvate dehydrogenase E2 component (dihydrolipoamide acetyltransferase)